MQILILALISVLALAGCGPTQVAEFWRPVSEPNLQMQQDDAQRKLEFDISQCSCGIFPANVTQPDLMNFQPDKQRYAQTGVTITAEDDGDCIQRPSLVVAECMRSRGWEVTRCSGRMPIAGGASLCAATAF